jgi:TonB family protein
MLRVLIGLSLAILPAAGFQNVAISDAGPSKRLIKMTKPVYPPAAKAAGIQGGVQLDVVITTDGTVKEIRNASGRPELIPGAADAVKEWIYEPVLKDSQPVDFIVTVTVNFSLPKNNTPVHPGKAEIEIGGNIQESKLINKVRPAYPPDAKAAGLEGSVKARVVIGDDGMLKEILNINGPLAFIQPCADAIRQWIWKPTTVDGVPVAVITEIQINFRLAR